MADEQHAEQEELLDGLVQLRFSDEEGNVHDLNAAELAEVLQGLVEFTSQMAKAGMFGDGMPPEVRVRPPQEGSVIIEALIQWANANPEMAYGSVAGAGGLVTQGINLGVRKLRGDEPSDFEHLDNGNVKITWPGDKVNEVPRHVWERLNAMKRPTRKALRKLMAPLGDDVQQLEIRDGDLRETTEEVLQSEPEVVANRTDYRIAAHEEDEVVEEIETFEAEAQLTSIDFRPGEKWRVHTLHGSRLATIEDEEFLRELDRGMALHKNDIFDVEVQEHRTIKNGRTTKEWSLTRVRRKRRGEYGDTDDSTPRNPSEG